MLELVSQNRVHSGWHQQYRHRSTTLNCDMQFAIFLPENASQQQPVPVLYWLSGLTCTCENFMQKAMALRTAAALGLAIVAADTSPRGDAVADDPEGAYDLGLGAGFYVNATEAPWREHYQMYDYIVSELPALIEANFPVSQARAIAGHSMGGHGALTIGLRNRERYRSISAFSPICHPTDCPWGQKALTAYLGAPKSNWAQYDAVEVIKVIQSAPPIRIDQGEQDPHLAEQLKPEALLAVASERAIPIDYRAQAGYDHSYFFIQSFIDEHLNFHAQHLGLSR